MDVPDRARLLAPGGEDDFGQQVRAAGGTIASASSGATASTPRAMPVPAHELLARPLRRGDQVGRGDGHPERQLVRDAARVVAVALDDPVDGLLGHPPPGRELAARDR